MKIGIFSDSHDNLEHLTACLNYFDQHNIETALFCGDFCSPIPVKKCIANAQCSVHAVYGNTEDRHTITQLAHTEIPNLTVHGEFAELEIESRKVFLTHYPIYAQALARTGDYDAVFHGHNHTAKKEHIGECLLANPGEILGAFEDARFGVYNTDTNDMEFILLKEL